MLDIHRIAHDPKKVIKKLQDRLIPNAESIVNHIIAVNQKRKQVQKESDRLSQELNLANKEMAALFANNPVEAKKKQEKLLSKKNEQKQLAAILAEQEKKLKEQLLQMPNLPYDDVVLGGKDNNQVIKEWHPASQSKSNLLPHWDLIKIYDLVDFELGNKITGAGFPVYKGKGAQLQRALINFFLDQATCAGYQEVQPPLLVNQQAAIGTGQLPDKEGIMYSIQENSLYLIPTAEVPVTNLYREKIIAAEELPIKHVSYTPCFRREAGSWGSHVRGLNRLHQFDKIELVEIHKPDRSRQALSRMIEYATGLLEKLQLPYRLLQIATGDLGFTSAITYDIEVLSPGQNKWLEVSSISCFDTYQARRMHLRYREKGKIYHCHTLNGSALALPRVVAALLEHGQTYSTIIIPSVLAHYTGWDAIQKE
ncbi:MAG: serine--tRNA ligase [Bacteroidota bacterium]